jgi:clan AA aspartic protease
MITGGVNANVEATIRIQVRGTHGQGREIEAVIDTGFSGFLTLPSSLADSLDLRWLGHSQGVLADGSVHLFEVYGATVVWDGEDRLVEVDAADSEPLVGMALMQGYQLRIQAVAGGHVSLEALG